jgi:RNA polymerase sigma factor (sigma-70 family)
MRRQATVHHPLGTLFQVGSFAGLTDGQLLERIVTREGDDAESAFAALVDRHSRIVLSTCQAVLHDEHAARDAFQATFLVLVRKVGSLWVRDSLGPWLHRVAYRVATHARRDSLRRTRAEREAAERAPWRTAAVGSDDDASIVHEELDKLPERYRIPVVLCDLEGRSYEEAARHMGCPVGTVKSRLARGRESLRGRLVRRGLASSTVLLGSGLSSSGAKAELPAGLASDTIRLAIGTAPAPAPVAILVEEALRAMIMRTVRTVAAVFVVLGLVSMGLGSVWVATGPTQATTKADDQTKANAVDPSLDPDTMLGTWVRVSTSVGQDGNTVKMKIKKDTDARKGDLPAGAAPFIFTWKTEGDRGGGSANRVLLNATVNPKSIDFFPDQAAAPKVLPGIYRLEGETLTICCKATSGERPSGFIADQPGLFLDVYQRETPSPARSSPSPAPSTTDRTDGNPAAPIEENWSVRGNWIVRGYPSGQALALVSIDRQERRPWASLLSVGAADSVRLKESKLEDLHIADGAVHFTLRLKSRTEYTARIFTVDAPIPQGQARPKTLLGSMEENGLRFPAELERTDRNELDPKEASALALGNDDLSRFHETRDVNLRRAILEGMLQKYGDRPIAPIPAWCLAITLADAKAPKAEVRAAADRAIRLAARYGPEMERGTIDRIIISLAGSEGLADVVLDYARKAEAMLRASDSVADRTTVLKNLAAALRRSGKRDEAEAVDDRIAELTPSSGKGATPVP